jgi:SPP1 gp7 family putative phage head morphogenesis protein
MTPATADTSAPAVRAAAERLGRRLVEIVRRHGPANSPSLVAAVVRELARWEPRLARTWHDGQVRAFVDAARALARQVEGLPPRLPPSLPRLSPAPGDTPPLVRFPAIDRAVRYLQERAPLAPDEWEDLDRDAQAVGFTVARAAGVDAVGAIQRALAEDVREGGTLGQFRARVADALAGSAVGPAQLETIYRTSIGRAHSAGQIAVLEQPLVAGAFPYLMWSATHDSRVRPEHLMMERLGLDGTAVYRADDPIFDTFYPPFAWNCRCVVIPLSVADAAEQGVTEARRRLRTGRPPAVPEFVPPPPFSPPAGWVPTGRRLSAV